MIHINVKFPDIHKTQKNQHRIVTIHSPQSLTSEFLMKQKLQMSYHISARAMNTKDAIVDRSRVQN